MINQVIYKNYLSQYNGIIHINNITKLQRFTDLSINKMLGKNKSYVKEVIFTDTMEATCKKYSKGEARETDETQGVTIPNDNKYYIIINYKKAIDNSMSLIDITKHNIVHEIFHVYHNISDRKILNDFEDNINERENDCTLYLTKLMFKEFKAEYNAQLLYPIEWDVNKYNVEKNIEKSLKKYNDIISLKELINFSKESLDEIDKKNITKLTDDTVYFIKQMIYDFALSVAQNAADNYRIMISKEIDIKIDGIDENIDKYFNQLFTDFKYKNEWNLLNTIYTNIKLIYDYVIRVCLER